MTLLLMVTVTGTLLLFCFVLHHFRSENPKNYRSIFFILRCLTRVQSVGRRKTNVISNGKSMVES